MKIRTGTTILIPTIYLIILLQLLIKLPLQLIMITITIPRVFKTDPSTTDEDDDSIEYYEDVDVKQENLEQIEENFQDFMDIDKNCSNLEELMENLDQNLIPEHIEVIQV